MVVKYKPGKELLIADALSRSFITDHSSLLDEEIQAQVCMIRNSLPINDIQYNQFCNETLNDPSLMILRKLIEKD